MPANQTRPSNLSDIDIILTAAQAHANLLKRSQSPIDVATGRRVLRALTRVEALADAARGAVTTNA